MRIITYLAFTLLSIVLQFCVMDLIQEKNHIDNKKPVDLNITSHKKDFNDILGEINIKPHALFYRMNVSKSLDPNKKLSSIKAYSNMSVSHISLETTTAFSNTIFDILYDENTSTTEESLTTESLLTSTEFDNVTEISLYINKSNNTDTKPVVLKKTIPLVCGCNLLYKACDINCCCDGDCTENERKLFTECISGGTFNADQNQEFCYLYNSYYSKNNDASSLFCVVSTNLPEKRKINHLMKNDVNNYFKWHTNSKIKKVEKYTNKLYGFGDTIWILRNNTLSPIDLPSPKINNYCSGRAPVKLLQEENIICNVKLLDLEIFHIFNTFHEAVIISAKENSLNSSVLNCSTLHCTKWTIIVCDEARCSNYNKSLHDPLCTENTCTNIAVKIDYMFYYHESKIIKAIIKLYTKKISLVIPFITQEIKVLFYITNTTADQMIKLSGNPGYIRALPVIVSFAESNYTDYFYGNSSRKDHLSYPENKNDVCVSSNITENPVLFGSNQIIKCRYYQVDRTIYNNENACIIIQDNINQLLGLNSKIAVSPLGNPYGLKDEDWLIIENEFESTIFGEINLQKTELRCYNIITRISFIFMFADVSDVATKRENKIITAKFKVTASNVTFSIDDMFTILTVDTVFIDITKESTYQYAGGPHLNMHLPKDFFLPFHSNTSSNHKCDMWLIFVIIEIYLIK